MQKIKEAVLSSKGQITVPKAIREILHVENGDSLVFYIEDDEVKITSTNNLDIKLKNEKRKAYVRTERIKKWEEVISLKLLEVNIYQVI